MFRAARAFSAALEAKETGTVAHTERVAGLSIAMGRDLCLPEERLPILAVGALLHDVGKIDVPDDLLSKAGPLTDAERAVVNQHPLGGWRILSGSPLLADVAMVARCHHERYDGSGYPDGLVGATIPFEARIVAVADVFDALSSDRPYRAAWSRERALAEIAGQRGRQFDPHCVDALFRVVLLSTTGD